MDFFDFDWGSSTDFDWSTPVQDYSYETPLFESFVTGQPPQYGESSLDPRNFGSTLGPQFDTLADSYFPEDSGPSLWDQFIGGETGAPSGDAGLWDQFLGGVPGAIVKGMGGGGGNIFVSGGSQQGGQKGGGLLEQLGLGDLAPFLGQMGGLGEMGALLWNLLGPGTRQRSITEEVPMIGELLTEAMRARTGARTYAEASLDPSSPYFRNLAGLYREDMMDQVTRSIRELMRQDQRARARGLASGLFEPSRRDEAIASATAKAGMNVARQSDILASQSLLNASKALAGTPSGTSDILSLFGSYGNMNDMVSRSTPALTAATLKRLTDILTGGKDTAKTGNAPAEMIIEGASASDQLPPEEYYEG